MLSPALARRFADSWYAAWNARDLDAIMACYAPQIEHSSPFIARYTSDPTAATLKGKEAVRAYFGAALARNAVLRFDPLHLTIGVESVILVYKRFSPTTAGEMSAELFVLEGAGGDPPPRSGGPPRAVRSISHYPDPTP